MNSKRANLICLKKMVKYCDTVISICRKHHFDRDLFEKDEEFQYACGMCIIQIGELVGRLDETIRAENPDIPWNSIKGMRNIFAHEYDIVDSDTLWNTVTEDIPALKEKLSRMLHAEK